MRSKKPFIGLVIYVATLIVLITLTIKAYYAAPSITVKYGNITIVDVKNIDPDEIKVVGNKIVILYDDYSKLITFDIPTTFTSNATFYVCLILAIFAGVVGAVIVLALFEEDVRDP